MSCHFAWSITLASHDHCSLAAVMQLRGGALGADPGDQEHRGDTRAGSSWFCRPSGGQRAPASGIPHTYALLGCYGGGVLQSASEAPAGMVAPRPQRQLRMSGAGAAVRAAPFRPQLLLPHTTGAYTFNP